ncbi:hypothetical protein GQ457_09G025410 [Hibiscus cannabinus]
MSKPKENDIEDPTIQFGEGRDFQSDEWSTTTDAELARNRGMSSTNQAKNHADTDKYQKMSQVEIFPDLNFGADYGDQLQVSQLMGQPSDLKYSNLICEDNVDLIQGNLMNPFLVVFHKPPVELQKQREITVTVKNYFGRGKTLQTCERAHWQKGETSGCKGPVTTIIVQPFIPQNESKESWDKVKVHSIDIDFEIEFIAAGYDIAAKEISSMVLMKRHEINEAYLSSASKKKSNAAEIESLREKYHQRVSTIVRKIYDLTKKEILLRRELNKKKHAAQEAHIRELEEKKTSLTTRFIEENKVESIKYDKTATEKLLQETITKYQAKLAAQKDLYTNALNFVKEDEALSEALANNDARTELKNRLRETYCGFTSENSMITTPAYFHVFNVKQQRTRTPDSLMVFMSFALSMNP